MPGPSPGEGQLKSHQQNQVRCQAYHSPTWLPAMENQKRRIWRIWFTSKMGERQAGRDEHRCWYDPGHLFYKRILCCHWHNTQHSVILRGWWREKKRTNSMSLARILQFQRLLSLTLRRLMCMILHMKFESSWSCWGRSSQAPRWCCSCLGIMLGVMVTILVVTERFVTQVLTMMIKWCYLEFLLMKVSARTCCIVHYCAGLSLFATGTDSEIFDHTT